MHFSYVFGDAPSDGYEIYVVLHVTYGWTYVEAAHDDFLPLSRGALSEVVLGGVDELIEEGNMGMPRCHHVTYYANTSVGQYYFHVLISYIYMYYCFLNIKRAQKNNGGL